MASANASIGGSMNNLQVKHNDGDGAAGAVHLASAALVPVEKAFLQNLDDLGALLRMPRLLYCFYSSS
jgi:hypothetical protein